MEASPVLGALSSHLDSIQSFLESSHKVLGLVPVSYYYYRTHHPKTQELKTALSFCSPFSRLEIGKGLSWDIVAWALHVAATTVSWAAHIREARGQGALTGLGIHTGSPTRLVVDSQLDC